MAKLPITEPQILIFDFETSPCIFAGWGCGKQYVGMDQILKEWVILTVCYRWLHEKKVHTLKFDLTKHKLTQYDDESDLALVTAFMEVYNSADLVVAHNGRKFDVPKLRARLVKHGLGPINPILIDDTYVATKPIGFTSHKLDYLGKFLNIGRKIETKFSMWLDITWCHDSKALDKMAKYCAQDTQLLAEVYKKLVPHMKTSLNRSLFSRDSTACPKCGVPGQLIRHGYRYTGAGVRTRFLCKACGATSQSGKNLIAHSGDYPR